jgi:magnesium-transporting ATPase (P-type)
METVTTSSATTNCHAQDGASILAALRSGRGGLAGDEAKHRLAQFGPNLLPPPRRRGPLQRFLLQFHNVLIYVLLAAGAVTATLGHWVDTGVIVGVVLVNAVIGFLQEGKAERALEAIRGMLSLHAQALRNGRRKDIPAEELVPGDVVFLASGDKVPADLRLLEVRNLRIDEAVLTGESVPVEKGVDAVAVDAPLGDRVCMAHSGTLVTYGQGVGVVTATGGGTEIGRISALLAEVQQLTTPLLRQMAVFARWLTWAILTIAAFAFAFGTLVRHYTASEMFLAAVGLAVAAIPEGLPAIMTITLAIGVQRMARRNAIIRRLPAVETLGSVTVICSDKTGTLTRNEMTVQRVITAGPVFAVSGAGYAPQGGFALDGGEVLLDDHPQLREIARAGLLCNDAVIDRAGDEWRLSGDPTEGALVTLAMKAGLDPVFEREALPRTDVIPFESEHQFMASLHHDHAGHGVVYLKGAPERVLERCSSELDSGEPRLLRRSAWRERAEEVAAAGMRLIAVAMRTAAGDRRGLSFGDIQEGGFTLLAVLGIADPPRNEAREAVAACRSAGIGVKMITGDHAITARAIGAQLGLAEEVTVVSGADLETLSDAELEAVAERAQIFARASPEHKLRLVQALQSRGAVVAMTGDGVNDAPALKRADVGVAMGRKGTEAAKEAAEMVLADDNFASIVAAVEEGRTVYDNLRKAIVFILPTNGGEAGMVLIAILLGMVLPITPAQILWVNMITAVTLALAIAFERPEADIMLRPPRDPRAPLLSGFLIWRIAFVSALLVAGSLGLFVWEQARGAGIEAARTVAVNALVVGEIVYLFNCRHLRGSVLHLEGLLGNRWVLVASGILLVFQMLFTYLPTVQALFGTAGLDASAWARIAMFGAVLFVIMEAEKAVVRKIDEVS